MSPCDKMEALLSEQTSLLAAGGGAQLGWSHGQRRTDSRGLEHPLSCRRIGSVSRAPLCSGNGETAAVSHSFTHRVHSHPPGAVIPCSTMFISPVLTLHHTQGQRCPLRGFLQQLQPKSSTLCQILSADCCCTTLDAAVGPADSCKAVQEI